MIILVTGPESTGKSVIVNEIATAYNIVEIKEYARTYLEAYGPGYTYEDIGIIAKKHVESFHKQKKTAFVLDTYLLNLKIWSEDKFGKVDPFITDSLVDFEPDLCLLMYPDIEWRKDKLRENPTDRFRLFQIFETEIQKLEWNYSIIRGNGMNRFKHASKAIYAIRKQKT